MRLAPAIPLADVLEADWQRTVVQLARTLGWAKVYHTYNSRKSAHGFPDLILLRDRLVAIEVKREKTKLTDEQAGWVRALLKAQVEIYVVRPRDLEAIAAVLAARRNPDGQLSTPAAQIAAQQLLEELRKELSCGLA